MKRQLFLLLILLSINLIAQVTPTERAALQAIYNALDGPNWNSQDATADDWNFAQPITNDWYGVTVVAGHIEELIISHFNDQNNLSGHIPAAIGNLPFLKVLEIEYADLTGTTIPDEIGNLTALTTLELGSNNLNGPLPVSIGNLIHK